MALLWRPRCDSNARPLTPQASALSTELRGRLERRNAQTGIVTLTARNSKAGREGFEPSSEFNPGTRLAGGRTRPDYATSPNSAEGEGFEPPVGGNTHSGFQDRRLRPLGHPSKDSVCILNGGDFTIAADAAEYPALGIDFRKGGTCAHSLHR